MLEPRESRKSRGALGRDIYPMYESHERAMSTFGLRLESPSTLYLLSRETQTKGARGPLGQGVHSL